MTVVDDLCFEVADGSILGFLGPNGAGKTTTLRMLLGLAEPTAGSATINGQRYRTIREPIQTVGAVLDSSGFHPGRSGRNHLRVIARASGLPRGRVEEVLSLVELKDAANRRADKYSLGMRQRLNLAGALLGDPRLLILDEPANGLEPQGIRWLRDFLRSLAAESRTVLVSSHVLAEVAQTVDEVVVIHRGKLRAHSTLAALTASRGAVATVSVKSPDAERLAALLRQQGAIPEHAEAGHLVVSASTAETIGEVAAANGIVLHELVGSGDASLEEVFIELTTGSDVEGSPGVGA